MLPHLITNCLTAWKLYSALHHARAALVQAVPANDVIRGSAESGPWVHEMSLGPCRKLTPPRLHVWPDLDSIFFTICDENHTAPSDETGKHDPCGYK